MKVLQLGLAEHQQRGFRQSGGQDTDGRGTLTSTPPSVLILQVAEVQTRCNWLKAGEHSCQVASPLQGGSSNKKAITLTFSRKIARTCRARVRQYVARKKT